MNEWRTARMTHQVGMYLVNRVKRKGENRTQGCEIITRRVDLSCTLGRYLGDNKLSTLPDGIFDSLINLKTL